MICMKNCDAKFGIIVEYKVKCFCVLFDWEFQQPKHKLLFLFVFFVFFVVRVLNFTAVTKNSVIHLCYLGFLG